MPDDRTYVKLHDGFDEHPKVAGLSDKEFRTYVEALCYSARNLTDGRISYAVAHKIAPPRVLYALVKVGLFEASENPKLGYVIHDYLEHQRSAEQVKQLKEMRREAGKRGGKAKANALASASHVASVLLKQTPSKALPDTETEKYKNMSDESDAGDGFEDFWRHYPRKEAKAAARKAWDKVAQTSDVGDIIDGLTAYAFSSDPKYRPLPASWLNGKRWQDEPALRLVKVDPHAGKIKCVELSPGQWREIGQDEYVMGKKTEWR